MSTLGKITRRTFLVGSVAIAGGVAFGYWTVSYTHLTLPTTVDV